MKTPKTHSRVALIPGTLLAFSLLGLGPTSLQAQSPQPASKGAAVMSPPQKQASQSAPTLAASIDRQVSGIEKLILDVAEAMPEEKFNFTPESLKISGSDYKGVFTFAGAAQARRCGELFHLLLWLKQCSAAGKSERSNAFGQNLTGSCEKCSA
jgi:hypothetical protein